MKKDESGEPGSKPDDELPDDPQTDIDDQPEVQAAANLVEEARERLRAAEACYQKLREQAVEKVQQVRTKTVGDLIDYVLATARKRPLFSLFTAGLLGYLLGRLFRR